MDPINQLNQQEGDWAEPGYEYEGPIPEESPEPEGLAPIEDPTQLAEQQLNPSNMLGGAVDAVTGAAGAVHGAIVGNKWQDLQAWRGMPPGPEREAAREEFFQTHYGQSYEDFQDLNLFEYLRDDFKNQQLTTSSWAPAAALSLLDLQMDAIGLLPGGAALDDNYDEFTKLNDPLLQSFRKLSGIVLPTLMGSNVLAGKLSPMMTSKDMPWLTKALTNVGAYGSLDAALMGISDVGEEDTAAKVMSDFFPEVFGKDGWIPLPDFIKTLDGDSPAVRKQKNMYESAGLSVISNLLGFYLQVGKPSLKWFKPKDKAAFKYKNIEESLHADNKVLIEIQELDELLAKTEGKITKNDKKVILQRRKLLVEKAEMPGTLEDYVKKAEKTQEFQVNEAAKRKLKTNPDNIDIDPDVNPMFVSESNRAQQSIPPANVARNMAETTALDMGNSTGSPAPIVTEHMRNKALKSGDTSRGAVVGVAELARDAGEFNAIIDGFKYTNKQMNGTAWCIYKKIIEANNLDDVKNLYFDNRSVNQLADIVDNGVRSRKFKEIAEEDEVLLGSLAALRELTDRYLGRGIMQSSARVMSTLGKEISDISEAVRTLTPHIDEDRAMDLILDKMEFLLTEIGINKYIRGWQLQRINAWQETLSSIDDPITAINTLKSEFTEAETLIAKKSQRFTKELKRVQQENPAALKALVAQFERSGGQVDTLEKLMIWAREEVTPLGMIVSPKSTMNKFASSSFAVAYNNMLSGLATAGATLGNTVGLIGKPITAVLGGTLEGLLSGGNFNKLKRSMYYYGGMMETNNRILRDVWRTAKKSWKDPDAMLSAARTDLVQQEAIDWTTLDSMRDLWEDEGNWGRVMQLDAAKVMYDLSRWAPFRVGMVGLNAADAGLTAAIGTYVSRLRAYDEVFTKYGKIDIDTLKRAEKRNYVKYFDKNGLATDEATKVLSGEIALNLQDDLSDSINGVVNKYPFMKTVLAFPRTLTNNLRLNLSWTGVQAIPGLTKYGDVIWAKTDEEIAHALRRHGLDPDRTPNAMTIFENLRTEYKGRLAFSSLLATGLYGYAMSGNITGNGSYDGSQRRIDRDQFGFKDKHIKLGGKWVSYEGIPMVEPVLTILGDLAYNARDINSSISEDILNKLIWTLSATFLQNSIFTGLEPFVQIMNNDLTGFSRYAANTTRMFLPMSGAAGVLAKAIDSSQKDIHDNVMHYIINRTPIVSLGLPKAVDIYTGKYVNDYENPTAKILNSLSKIKVSSTNEPWRVKLREIGYDGASILRKDSTGTYEYTASEREYLNKLIGMQEPWRKIEKILNSPKHKKQIDDLRAHIASGRDLSYGRVTIDGKRMPIYREIDFVMEQAQKNAELIMRRERPDIWDTVIQQRLINRYIEQGQLEEARGVADQNQQMVENLINLPK